MINVDKLFDLMADKGFQEPRTGNLFFPAYIYTYPSQYEYQIREKIELIAKKLARPNHYLDCLVVNIYQEIISYLKSESFARKSLFEHVLEKEKEDPEEAFEWVKEEINAGDFYDKFEIKLKSHFEKSNDKRVYLIIHGFGSSFPYLRASELLKRLEKSIKDFKIIVFYPGEYKDSNYSLFELLQDDNMYRANHLNNLLGE
jgi:hypothetical protein